MPRQARLDAPGTLHHVMARGIEGTDIFGTDKDRGDFLDRLAAQCEVEAPKSMPGPLFRTFPPACSNREPPPFREYEEDSNGICC